MNRCWCTYGIGSTSAYLNEVSVCNSDNSGRKSQGGVDDYHQREQFPPPPPLPEDRDWVSARNDPVMHSASRPLSVEYLVCYLATPYFP